MCIHVNRWTIPDALLLYYVLWERKYSVEHAQKTRQLCGWTKERKKRKIQLDLFVAIFQICNIDYEFSSSCVHSFCPFFRSTFGWFLIWISFFLSFRLIPFFLYAFVYSFIHSFVTCAPWLHIFRMHNFDASFTYYIVFCCCCCFLSLFAITYSTCTFSSSILLFVFEFLIFVAHYEMWYVRFSLSFCNK